jgi:electron transport complex protein RnfC
MMGFTVASPETPVTKGTGGVTVLTENDVRKGENTTCLRCGRCVDVCPLNLVPAKIARAAQAEDMELAERYHAAACVECGCCAYVCPAGIPLVQLIRVGKILSQRVEAARAS